MTKPIIKIVNTTTGEELEREMNADELAQWEADQAAEIARVDLLATTAAARQAILNRLGLTADEAALLLGANQ
jgi:hypothetical protein